MRKLWLSKDDFELFHQDITPSDFEFFRTHSGAFKRMWQEQSRRFWSIYVSTFEYFIWNYGVMKDFPMKAEEMQEYIDEIMFYIRDQCVDGKATTARNLVMDSVMVTQHKHCIALLDKVDYTQNPFYMKETREIFRQLFGSPDSKRTFMKVLCGFPVYVKFAGSSVTLLRRWLSAEEIDSDDELAKNNYFSSIHHKKCIGTPMLDSYKMKAVPTLARALMQPEGAEKTRLLEKAVKQLEKDFECEPKKKRKRKKKSKSDKTKETPEQQQPTNSKEEKSKSTDKQRPKTETIEAVDASLQTNSSVCDTEKLPTPDDGASKYVEMKDGTTDKRALDEGVKSETTDNGEDDVKPETNDNGIKAGTTDNGGDGVKARTTDIGDDSVKPETTDKTLDGIEADKIEDQKQDDVNTGVIEDKDKAGASEEEVETGPTSNGDCTVPSDGQIMTVEETVKGLKHSSGDVSEPNQQQNGEESSTVAIETKTTPPASAPTVTNVKKKLHLCACCGKEETMPKTFKRCQKCRGKPDPKYYCSRDCQAKDWKTHKLDHKDD